jgi:hypothetical protein
MTIVAPTLAVSPAIDTKFPGTSLANDVIVTTPTPRCASRCSVPLLTMSTRVGLMMSILFGRPRVFHVLRSFATAAANRAASLAARSAALR